MNPAPPCLLFEDDDLLVVNKPAGINTHSPAPNSNEGLYDWLRKQDPRWASLALIHRLDKDTSGIVVFAKSTRASQSLTRQFSERSVHKTYLLLTDRPGPTTEHRLRTALVRSGDRYHARPPHAGADIAETTFRPAPALSGHQCVLAQPLTGKTHQVRVHAAVLGFPILGDALYGGSPAARICLHAQRLELNHPATGERRTFQCPAQFDSDPRLALRSALIDPAETNALRLIHGSADDHPGWYVDRFGDVLLSQSAAPITREQRERLATWLSALGCQAAYHKILLRQPDHSQSPSSVAPQLVLGRPHETVIDILENGVRYQIDLQAGYSVGLFLDQRDNRRALLTHFVAPGFHLPFTALAPPELLNTFAYTGGFSVCAALSGARTTSIDLSGKYLDWAKTNFHINRLSPENHSFVTGDVFDWLRRLTRKHRKFAFILLDPPTFSRSKSHGVFRAEKDYVTLVATALPLLEPGGILFASANTLRLPAKSFVDAVSQSVSAAGRRILRKHFATQGFDFPITRAEPAHLKSLWLQVQ